MLGCQCNYFHKHFWLFFSELSNNVKNFGFENDTVYETMVTDILLPIMESWIGSRKIILTNIKNRRYLSGAKLSFHADQFPKYLLNIVLQVYLLNSFRLVPNVQTWPLY